VRLCCWTAFRYGPTEIFKREPAPSSTCFEHRRTQAASKGGSPNNKGEGEREKAEFCHSHRCFPHCRTAIAPRRNQSIPFADGKDLGQYSPRGDDSGKVEALRAMSSRSYASLLRDELSARNASYAALHQLPHVTSYGEVPVVVYQPLPCGTKHGNFIPASYRALQRRPQWKRRFEKVHSQAGRAFPKSDCVSKELDSSMSSDALLMNIFCYPGVTKRRELSLMLGTEIGDLPEFGFKPRIPLTSAHS
jgi:hypothetical protein